MQGTASETLLIELAEQSRNRFYGKYRGVVSNVDDPENRGRIRAYVNEILADIESPWALPCSPYAGDGMGLYTIPPVGAGVWIEFEAGDPSRPVWVGCWWGDGQLPQNEQGTDAAPAIKMMRSESGMVISMDDDSNSLAVSDANGDNILQLDINGGVITVRGGSKAVVEAPAIELVESATHPVVFGDELMTYLNQVVQMFQSHTHPGETAAGIPVSPAPPTPPLPAPSQSMLSSKVKAG